MASLVGFPRRDLALVKSRMSQSNCTECRLCLSWEEVEFVVLQAGLQLGDHGKLETALKLGCTTALRKGPRDQEVFGRNGGFQRQMFQCRGLSLGNINSDSRDKLPSSGIPKNSTQVISRPLWFPSADNGTSASRLRKT
jgi:hypothetical protein